MKKIDVQDAVGMALCHDITAVRDGFKGAAFKRGHVITDADVPALLDLGKKHVFVWEESVGVSKFLSSDIALNLWKRIFHESKGIP